jgi:hypothetical protein
MCLYNLARKHEDPNAPPCSGSPVLHSNKLSFASHDGGLYSRSGLMSDA